MIYIFLDIDGVLVREVDIAQETYGMLNDKCLTIFESALRPYQNFYKIVISSAWREIFDLDLIKSKFSPDIAQNIVDVTPFLDAYADIKFYRYQEVLKYLEDYAVKDVKWIAIDDIKEHFPPEIEPYLIHTNPEYGFRFADASKLMDLLDKLNN